MSTGKLSSGLNMQYFIKKILNADSSESWDDKTPPRLKQENISSTQQYSKHF